MARKSPSSRSVNLGIPTFRIPIVVVVAADGLPTAVGLNGRWTTVDSVGRQWDVTEVLAGQERPIKTYFQIIIPGGETLTIFRNRVTGSWYQEYPQDANK